jgi:6-phosphogluconolactonase (cycloisomerase 2 family)
VASEHGDNIVIFELNPKTGELKRTAVEENVPTPVCLKFVPVAA